MFDLVMIEEDMRPKEPVICVLPPFCMELCMECFELTFKFFIECHQRLIRIHLDLVGFALGFWGRICCKHLGSVVRVTDVAAR